MLGLCLIAAACSERPREREVALEARSIKRGIDWDISSAERFGMDPDAFAMAPAGSADDGVGQTRPTTPGEVDVSSSMAQGASGFTWQAPEGWRKAPERRTRVVTFHMGPDDTTECYVTSLAGTAGGVQPNLDRWRRQMGAQPMSAAEFAGLELVGVAGVDAPLVEVDGSYSGMNGEQVSDAKLIGTVAPLGNKTLFIKLIGPREVVDAERNAFLAFAKSLGTQG